jgi:uncharacterized membrane protein
MMAMRHLLRSIAFMWALALLPGAVTAPAAAHKEHKKPVAAEVSQPPRTGAPAAARSDPGAAPAATGPTAEGTGEDRSKMTTVERLVDWLGRLHPTIVHFPIAFFPAALVTAIVGRRRPAFETPIRFLVIAGGILAPIAALLGWFDGGFNPATDDALLEPHRWLGTAIGLGGSGLAIWAWRRAGPGGGPAMVVALGIITAAILVQGWFGGALVHGADHLNW